MWIGRPGQLGGSCPGFRRVAPRKYGPYVCGPMIGAERTGPGEIPRTGCGPASESTGTHRWSAAIVWVVLSGIEKRPGTGECAHMHEITSAFGPAARDCGWDSRISSAAVYAGPGRSWPGLNPCAIGRAGVRRWRRFGTTGVLLCAGAAVAGRDRVVDRPCDRTKAALARPRFDEGPNLKDAVPGAERRRSCRTIRGCAGWTGEAAVAETRAACGFSQAVADPAAAVLAGTAGSGAGCGPLVCLPRCPAWMGAWVERPSGWRKEKFAGLVPRQVQPPDRSAEVLSPGHGREARPGEGQGRGAGGRNNPSPRPRRSSSAGRCSRNLTKLSGAQLDQLRPRGEGADALDSCSDAQGSCRPSARQTREPDQGDCDSNFQQCAQKESTSMKEQNELRVRFPRSRRTALRTSWTPREAARRAGEDRIIPRAGVEETPGSNQKSWRRTPRRWRRRWQALEITSRPKPKSSCRRWAQADEDCAHRTGNNTRGSGEHLVAACKPRCPSASPPQERGQAGMACPAPRTCPHHQMSQLEAAQS